MLILSSCSDNPNMCRFGSPISLESDGLLNSFLRGISEDPSSNGPVPAVSSWRVLSTRFMGITNPTDDERLVQDFIERSFYTSNPFGLNQSRRDSFTYTDDATDNGANEPWDRYFSVRTCNSFWNPQVPIRPTNVDPFYLGMASQATEREDTIITSDLRGNVSNNIIGFVNALKCIFF